MMPEPDWEELRRKIVGRWGEDVAQTVLCKLVRILPRLTLRHASLETYIYRMCQRAYCDEWRGDRNFAKAREPKFYTVFPDPQHDARELLRLVMRHHPEMLEHELGSARLTTDQRTYRRSKLRQLARRRGFAV